MSVFGVDRGGGHDEMHVGVEILSAGVGMQHRDGPWDAAKLAVVVAEGAHVIPGKAQHQVVDAARVSAGERAQLGGQGEGDQEVPGGDEPGKLSFDPLLALVVLTMRTMAMAALAQS